MRNRITIGLTEGLELALEDARKATVQPTISEVVRDALNLYELIVQHMIAGEHLYLGITADSAAEVLLPQLERAAGRLRAKSVQLAAVPADLAAATAPTPLTTGSMTAASARRRPTNPPPNTEVVRP